MIYFNRDIRLYSLLCLFSSYSLLIFPYYIFSSYSFYRIVCDIYQSSRLSKRPITHFFLTCNYYHTFHLLLYHTLISIHFKVIYKRVNQTAYLFVQHIAHEYTHERYHYHIFSLIRAPYPKVSPHLHLFHQY